MLTLFCRDEPVRTSRTRRLRHGRATARSSAHLLDRGVYVAPSQFEAMFLSLAHGDDEIDATVEAVADRRWR